MKRILLLFAFCMIASTVIAQQLPPHIKENMTYPVFDFDPWVGVMKSKAKALKYDKALDYKVVIDLVDAPGGSAKIMRQITEIARTYNLNVANGVPKRKLNMAVVVHGGAYRGFLTNEAYQKLYGIDNPNAEAISILKKEGIEFYICKQSLSFMRIPDEDIVKEVGIAVSAKTSLITLDQMGYSYMKISEN